MKPETVRLGYLLISAPIPGVFIGGLMVTDGRGMPLEFRYTEPIQPTKIQQILYGQVLSHYVKTEVITETLLKSMESGVNCLLVNDEALLASPNSKTPMMRLSETKSAPIGEVGTVQKLSDSEILLQITPEGSPLRITPSANAKAEPSAETDAAGNNTFKSLIEIGQQMDLAEPLQRIQKALETICQEAGIPSATK